ncbi:MAG: CAP domain-containing protein [Planctomycetaceae bacterium]|nr:CAP domain-containing protein [Planctomycetaceae bacterium]
MATTTSPATSSKKTARSHKQVLIPFLLLLSIFVVIKATASADDTKPATKQPQSEKTDAEKTEPEKTTAEVTTRVSLLEQTNVYRRKYNRRPLVLNERLNQACEKLAGVMARTGRMSHSADGRSPSSRVRSAGYRGGNILENIAYRRDRRSKSNRQFAQSTLRQWINSSGHRRNLLNSHVTQCGIAFATNPRTGRTYVAMVYARGSNPVASPSTEKTVSQINTDSELFISFAIVSER